MPCGSLQRFASRLPGGGRRQIDRTWALPTPELRRIVDDVKEDFKPGFRELIPESARQSNVFAGMADEDLHARIIPGLATG
jgi:hypothetical protein